MKIEQYASIDDNGVLQLSKPQRQRFADELKALKGTDVVVIVKKRGKRSNPSNRFYWGVVIHEIKVELKRRGTYATPEDIHAALKAKFNPAALADANGEPLLEIGQSTADMNQSEFGEYLDKVIHWCNTALEIHIPEPGQQTDMFNQSNAA